MIQSGPDRPITFVNPFTPNQPHTANPTAGVLVFDEGHKAKKLVPEKEEGAGKPRGKPKSTKTALCVDDIQQRLPKARVCYVSATGASSLENLGYMTRVRGVG